MRVENGGHGIPDKDVERRYEESFRNLKAVLPLCNTVCFYDNTKDFNRFGVLENEKLDIVDICPEWFERVKKFLRN